MQFSDVRDEEKEIYGMERQSVYFGYGIAIESSTVLKHLMARGNMMRYYESV